MDVQCERCKAEYEFDDALISGRGTTVKCTNCGYQFKIRKPAQATDAGPDRWAVRTTEGRELVFTSLRELQKAIHARQVGRADTLTRPEGPARALGAIAELEPFFDEASEPGASEAYESRGHESGSGAKPMPDGSAKKPLMASAAVAQVPARKSSRPPPPLGGRTIPTLRPVASTPPPATLPVPAMRPRVDTIRPPASANAAVPPPLQPVKPAPAPSEPRPIAPVAVAPIFSAADGAPVSVEATPASDEPETARVERAERPPTAHAAPRTLVYAPPPPSPSYAPPEPPPPRRSAPAEQPQPGEMRSSPPVERLPPPTISLDSGARLPPPTVPVRMPEPRRALSSIDDDPDEIELAGRPRRLGGWLVALVLLGGAGILGFVVAKPYLEARTGSKPVVASTLDPRAAQMLTDGERALAAGDLEGANDAFTKASALAETDPRMRLDLARLANARADVPWLRARVLPAEATDDLRGTKAQLTELGARAKKAADEASAAAPDRPNAILAKIDALRITGDGAAARALVSKVIQNASQPETAYALAALDLAESEPLWPMVVERLRLASAGEGDAGRARAALVYALARSGDAAGAKAELEKLAGLARPYPVVGPLRAFVAKVPEARDAGASARGPVDVNALPRAGRTGGGGAAGGGGGGYSGSNDPRLLLAQAESAKSSRDFDRARALYSSALAQNASDSEALAGLGDVEHASHNPAGAAGYYKRALAVNPVYLPALVGLGDVEWESGDKDEAQKTYRDIMDRFPEGTYAPRVRQRGTDSSSASAPTTSATATAAAPSSGQSGGAQSQ